MKKSVNITTYDIVVVGLLAAVVFVATSLLRIPIATPTGPTQLKVANGLCLMFAILFGKWRGGAAAGLGSMLFDLFSEFASSAPYTLCFFFAMAFLCGAIAEGGSGRAGYAGKNSLRNTLACVAGAFSYVVMYITKNVITTILLGSAFAPAVAATVPKMITSSINAVFAVVIASLLTPIVGRELEKAGVLRRNKEQR